MDKSKSTCRMPSSTGTGLKAPIDCLSPTMDTQYIEPRPLTYSGTNYVLKIYIYICVQVYLKIYMCICITPQRMEPWQKKLEWHCGSSFKGRSIGGSLLTSCKYQLPVSLPRDVPVIQKVAQKTWAFNRRLKKFPVEFPIVSGNWLLIVVWLPRFSMFEGTKTSGDNHPQSWGSGKYIIQPAVLFLDDHRSRRF